MGERSRPFGAGDVATHARVGEGAVIRAELSGNAQTSLRSVAAPLLTSGASSLTQRYRLRGMLTASISQGKDEGGRGQSHQQGLFLLRQRTDLQRLHSLLKVF